MNITKFTLNPYFSLYQKKKRTFRSPLLSMLFWRFLLLLVYVRSSPYDNISVWGTSDNIQSIIFMLIRCAHWWLQQSLEQFYSTEYDYELKRTKRDKTCDRRKAPSERLRVLDSSKLDINCLVRTSPHVRTSLDLPYSPLRDVRGIEK